MGIINKIDVGLVAIAAPANIAERHSHLLLLLVFPLEIFKADAREARMNMIVIESDLAVKENSLNWKVRHITANAIMEDFIPKYFLPKCHASPITPGIAAKKLMILGRFSSPMTIAG